MKKRGFVVFFLITCMILLAGCKKEKKDISLNVSELSKEILNEGKFSSDMMELDSDVYDAQFPDLDTEKIAKGSIYVSSGATTDEIICLEAKNEKDADSLKEAVLSSISYQIKSNKDYLPDQVKKLQNPITIVNGKYIIVCVTDDKNKVNELLEKKDIIS